MTAVLISNDAVDAKLLIALLAKGLHRLHIGNVLVAELGDDPVLIDQGLVGVQVQQAGFVLEIALLLNRTWRRLT